MKWPCAFGPVCVPGEVMYRTANFPVRKRNVSLDAVPLGFAYRGTVETYLAKLDTMIQEGFGLLLWGPYRSGKTSLACVIALEVLRHYGRVLFLDSIDIMNVWFGEHPSYDQSSLYRPQLLILDNLGQEQGKEYTKAVVDAVVRHRAENKQSTIITTNISESELGRMYGEKFIALAKSCLYPVCVIGKDWGVEEEEKMQGAFK